MTQHHDSHKHHHAGHEHAHPAPANKNKIWVIIAIILMLVAMVAYIMSGDEAIEPEGKMQEEVPAAAL